MVDGEDSKVAESETKAEAAAPVGEKAESSGDLPAPFHGFDETGEYFVVRVHVKYGYIFILGWLEKAKDFLKMYVSKQMMDMQKKSLIKPNSKGFGRFNPFKRSI